MATHSIFGPAPAYVPVNYTPHAGQIEIIESLWQNFASADPASIVEIIASRGWGKTLFLCASLLVPYLNDHPNAKVMWVGPTYATAMAPVEEVFKGVNEVTGDRWLPDHDASGNKVWEFSVTATGPLLKWYTGATVAFKSADSPDSIVSRGYNLIVIDEAALIQEQVFTQQILGTARKAGIKIFMITSPRGKKHWTYKYYLRGQDKNEKNYLSYTQPYTKNPHFSPILAELIKDLPDWIYRQEYMAQFIDDGDTVFRNLDACLIPGDEIQFDSNDQEWSTPLTDVEVKDYDGSISIRKAQDRRFIVAMDLAKSKDFTVITVMDLETGDCVYYRRLNKTDYREIIKLCVGICHKYNNSELIYDATGVGAGVGDFLKNEDVVAHPYVFTNETKSDLINRLILSTEYAEIKLPNIVTIKNEFSAFTYELTRTGKISYNAPSGMHDDVVISVALGNWFRKNNSGNDEALILEDIMRLNGVSPKTQERVSRLMQEMAQDND
jgi:hypothetical protein